MSGMGGLNTVYRAKKQFASLSMRGEISHSSGIPLELFLPRRPWKHLAGHSNQMGKVKTKEIGQPACLPSKSAKIAHDGASETERISVDDEGLITPSRHKVQSLLVGNDEAGQIEQRTRCLFELNYHSMYNKFKNHILCVLHVCNQICKTK